MGQSWPTGGTASAAVGASCYDPSAMKRHGWAVAWLLGSSACTFGSVGGSGTVDINGTSSDGSGQGPATGGGDATGTATASSQGNTTGGPMVTGTDSTGNPVADSTGDPTTSGMTTTGEPGTTTGDTTGDDSSSGGPPAVMSDNGLIARYYLDEATSGEGPRSAADSAPDPIPLTMNYNSGQPEWTGPAADQTGLVWTMHSSTGYAAFGDVDQTKFEDAMETPGLESTIEVVVQIDDVGIADEPSRVFWIGDNQDTGTLALLAGQFGLGLGYEDSLRTTWPMPAAGRHVIHLVVDVMAADGSRTRLFVDGVEVAPGGLDEMNQGDALSVTNGEHVHIGNTLSEGRSIEGIIFYAGLYNAALTEPEIAGNAAVLLASDDSP